jgi:two-component system phosphate regulon response regulator PhoB
VASSHRVADETIRVLFIEDDPAVAEMYKLKLELDGYTVTITTPEDNALEIADAIRPELVFLDTQRHQDGGMATLRALRSAAATRSVPVIILSNQHPQELAASGFQTDVMDYVVHADLSLSSLSTLSRDIDQWEIGGRRGIPA